MINLEEQESPLPKTPRNAVISFILGLCSLPSLILFAFLLEFIFNSSHLLHILQYYSTYAPIIFILLFIVMISLLPSTAIFYGTLAKKTATSQTGQQLATTGLILGYISFLMIGGFLCFLFVLFSAFRHFS